MTKKKKVSKVEFKNTKYRVFKTVDTLLLLEKFNFEETNCTFSGWVQ